MTTASVSIVGTLRGIPDAPSAPSPDGGVPAHANFRSVLEQYRAPRENEAKSDDSQAAPHQEKKNSDPTSALVVPQAETPAVEVPRLILPFAASITLRQSPAASTDDAATEDSAAAAEPTAKPSRIGNILSTPAHMRSTLDLRSLKTANVEVPRLILPFATSITLRQSPAASPDDGATEVSATAAEPTAEPSGIANILPTPAHMRSTLDLRSLKTANSGAPPETQANLQDSTPSQTTAAPLDQTEPAEPSSALLPPSSTTSDLAGVAVQNRSTLREASAPDTVPTSTLDRGIAYQYRSSRERRAETTVIDRASQQPQREVQKVSNPAPSAAAPVPVVVSVPIANTLELQPPLHPPTGSNALRQDAPTLETNSAVAQDSSAASGSDPKSLMPPAVDRDEDTKAAPSQGSLAFAARLTPAEEAPAPVTDANRAADPQTRTPISLQTTTSVVAKRIVADADQPAAAHSGESGSQSDKEKTSDRFAKPDALLPQTHAATAVQTVAQATSPASVSPAPTSPLSPAARMDQVQDSPAPASTGNHDITVRIPDSTDQGTAVRFVERGGEVHVSVRTGDVEMAQTLRGGLNDLVGRLEDGGIRTQVWQPGADASTSQNDSHQPFADPDGSNGRQYPSGSNSEQESKQQNKPRWVEELEDSIGKPNFKEMTQSLWQA